ncbi:hypothetical protein [Streptomyces lancefieldiae]|uniref:Uncharacterized protein n=1 Tax=Streptomyces lancefieldiae TaxID=3075520 RepID=A0ABU3AVN9_9ACTN|nr:hypothetical protein [Streptomyces sp. DSM 40712]MDT0614214.1 hypothetical protein [Streptomyces sp. DSM 40712]
MHSEPAFESRAAVGEKPAHGRRRKRGNGSGGGPVFVDNSGRRARLLRRLGLLVGAVCVGYAAVLGLAFMGIGTSVGPSSLLPFGDGGGGQDGPGPGGGARPRGGLAPTGAPPTGTGRPGRPATTPSSTAAPSTAASSGAATATDRPDARTP